MTLAIRIVEPWAMAEDSDLEKTEEPSPRRLEKAREEGDIPRSRELSTFAGLIGAACGLWYVGDRIVYQLQEIIKLCLNFNRNLIEEPSYLDNVIAKSLINLLFSCLPFFGIVLLIGILSPTVVGGWIFSIKSIEPKLEKLDPLKGLSNIISSHSFVELIKSLLKTLIIGLVSWFVTDSMIDDIVALCGQPFRMASQNISTILLTIFTIISATFAVIAFVDAPYQLYRYKKKLMMSRQDLKDESKESEGNPETRAKIRSIQREMARKRMMTQIPNADVVITNPTHYAVALSYPENSPYAPKVLAKGSGHIALKIQEVAVQNKVLIVQSPPLARALYKHTELEQEIPSTLFKAVAQVLAYVFQVREWKKNGGTYPELPNNIEVPDALDPHKNPRV